MAERKSLTIKVMIIAIFAGIVSAAIGGAAGMSLGNFVVYKFGISAREGEAGMAVIAITILFGFLGLCIGSTASLFKSGIRGLRLLLAPIGSGAALALVAFFVASDFVSLTPRPLNANGLPPKLQFEILPPPDFSTDTLPQIVVALNTDQNSMDADIKNSTTDYQQNQHRIVGSVELNFRTSSRLLVVRLPGEEARIFKLKLSANPSGGSYREWSQWQYADFEDRPGLDKPANVEGENGYQLRYKIEETE